LSECLRSTPSANKAGPAPALQTGANAPVKSFIAKFQEKHKQVPDAMAALGYDVMRIVADAIERAKSTHPEAIRKALEETRNFPGVTGSITIDAGHNAVKPLVVLQLKDGKQQFVQAVQCK
jgi:branched-chain amino acid transport system substrate-binding protein